MRQRTLKPSDARTIEQMIDDPAVEAAELCAAAINQHDLLRRLPIAMSATNGGVDEGMKPSPDRRAQR